MTPLPMSVVGGFLGAGKTTLINRLLTARHGLELVVLVNDFGAINIDVALLKSSSENTIELTNGCVCCTMSGDLFFAIGDILDRPKRPDHLIIEASGVADPAKIARAAIAEPDLTYAGILTVVDGVNLPAQLADAQIAAQVLSQIQCADVVAVSKAPANDADIVSALESMGVQGQIAADDETAVAAFLFNEGIAPLKTGDKAHDHPAFATWSSPDPAPMTRRDIELRLACVPPGVKRVKAIIPGENGVVREVHVVGAQKTIAQHPPTRTFGVVAIGLKNAITPEEMAAWWRQDS